MAALSLSPVCFGNVSLGRGSPCGGCRFVGACAAASSPPDNTESPALSVWPRISAPSAQAPRDAPMVVLLDPTVAGRFADLARSLSMVVRRRVTLRPGRDWVPGDLPVTLRDAWTSGGTPVFVVAEANPTRCVVRFLHHLPGQMADRAAARAGVMLRPWTVEQAGGGFDRSRIGDRQLRLQDMRAHDIGTSATSTSADAMLALVAEHVRTSYPAGDP